MIKDKKNYRILVVEDNPGDLTIIEDFLSEQILNPNITYADSFKKASEILHRASFDVILLDLNLPDKNGQGLITEMLRIAHSCPIIILTGYSDINFSIGSISLGVMDYLLKDDLNATTLYKSITYSIERKKAISELSESEKRYSNLFRLSPQPMWVFDTETLQFIHVNKAAIDLYGYSEAEFLNMSLNDIKRKEDILQGEELHRIKYTDKGKFNQTVLHHKKSGEIIEVEIYSSPITIGNKIFRSVIAFDVTEKNHFEIKLIKAIIKTQEDERYEIGSELHDNVCQILAASQLSLGMLQESLPASEMPLFTRCRENIGLALNEIRNLSHRLAPVFFDDSTLEDAFQKLFDPFLLNKNCKVLLHFDDTAKSFCIPTDVKLNLYRIVQEQFRNIQKHAKASLIDVNVCIHDKKLKVRVMDNGIGFDICSTRKGIGIANMKRRTELFAGKFEINSSLGNGCEMIISIPL